MPQKLTLQSAREQLDAILQQCATDLSDAEFVDAMRYASMRATHLHGTRNDGNAPTTDDRTQTPPRRP